MNYCSLEDAWGGKCNQISNQYKNYMVEKNYTEPQPAENIKSQDFVVENFNNITTATANANTRTTQNQTKKILTKNDDHHLDELYDCDSFINHIRNCRKCHSKMRNYFKPKLVENFQDIIEDNRDTIVLILIGISILLFFNLINNMTK
jgi:FMN-dependent NADH-azoreductase